jgi:hypothetical protein
VRDSVPEAATRPHRAVDAAGVGGLDPVRHGLTSAPPGSLRGAYLVVDDIEAARAELVERGAQVSDFHEARLAARFLPEGAAER